MCDLQQGSKAQSRDAVDAAMALSEFAKTTNKQQEKGFGNRATSDSQQDRLTSDSDQDSRATSDSQQNSRATFDSQQDSRAVSDSQQYQDSRATSESQQDSKATSESQQDSKATSESQQDSKATSESQQDSKATSESQQDSKATSESQQDSKATSESQQDSKATSESQQNSKATSESQQDSRATSQSKQDSRATSDSQQDSRATPDSQQDGAVCETSDRSSTSPNGHDNGSYECDTCGLPITVHGKTFSELSKDGAGDPHVTAANKTHACAKQLKHFGVCHCYVAKQHVSLENRPPPDLRSNFRHATRLFSVSSPHLPTHVCLLCLLFLREHCSRIPASAGQGEPHHRSPGGHAVECYWWPGPGGTSGQRADCQHPAGDPGHLGAGHLLCAGHHLPPRALLDVLSINCWCWPCCRG